MDLKSRYPYWAVKNDLMNAFPQLDSELSLDVAAMGAGITGALIADELAGHGHEISGEKGITCSILGAELLGAQMERRPHPLTVLFSFAWLG